MAVSRKIAVRVAALMFILAAFTSALLERPTKQPPTGSAQTPPTGSAQTPPPGAAQSFLDAKEFERLMGVKLVFKPIARTATGNELGSGDHGGGKPPVTAHPNSPAFGSGVKVVMTDAEFFQFYQAYQSPKHPVFVTSDSLIQAFFGVLRKELIRQEAIDSWGLADAVVDGLGHLDAVSVEAPEEVTASARRLARINLAIVARLLNPRSSVLIAADEELIVKEEVDRVVAASAAHLPNWLHDQANANFELDYRLFRPIGDRVSDEAMRRFRAIRWLQIVPWRIDRDDHLLAILIAARATDQTGTGTALRDQALALLMPLDDIDSFQLAEWYGRSPLSVARLGSVREAAGKKLTSDPPRLNDLLRFPPKGVEKPTARWRSAGRSTDLVVLKEVFGQSTSNGLALCASLGSTFARTRTEAGDWSKAPSPADGDSLSAEWWRTAAALFSQPPKEAPAFMNGMEWKIKSCQTVLAGWVLWRHAVELYGKSALHYANGGPPKLRGAVEPNPDFFRRMERLCNETIGRLRSKSLLEPTPRRCAAEIPEHLDAIKRIEKRRDEIRQRKNLSPLGGRHDDDVQWRRWGGLPDLAIEITGNFATKNEYEAALVQLWSSANEHRWPSDEFAKQNLQSMDEPTERRLLRIAELANRCTQLAEKQLTGERFSESDDAWFLDYGRKLAGLAGYQADADDQPVDDAAKVADIIFDPQTDRYRVASVGRPRALWVLYPYQGTEVLCRGAVYPYYEFDSKEKPSDEAWQNQVRAGKQPPQPEWIKPLLREGTPEKNVEK